MPADSAIGSPTPDQDQLTSSPPPIVGPAASPTKPPSPSLHARATTTASTSSSTVSALYNQLRASATFSPPSPSQSSGATPTASTSTSTHLPSLLRRNNLPSSRLSTASLSLAPPPQHRHSSSPSSASSSSTPPASTPRRNSRVRRAISTNELGGEERRVARTRERSSSASLALLGPEQGVGNQASGGGDGDGSASDGGREDGGSDGSSGFAGLLRRVGGSIGSGLNTMGPKSANAKGKARAAPAEELLAPFAAEVEAEEAIDVDSIDEGMVDEEGELVGREEGQVDPRELLREQLRRNKSRGMGRVRSAFAASDVAGIADAGTISDLEPSTSHTRYTPRRYFILSTAGKLIFTTDEDEEEATGYVGVMQAIISIFADEGDKIRYVDAGETKIAFLLKPPLYLVCVSDWGEPESVLRTHLDYLYLQVLSVVTQSQLSAIFARRSNFDLRRLLEGTEAFFTTLTATLQTSLPILTSCLEVYRMEPSVRDEIAKAVSPPKPIDDLLYAIVLAHSRVVTLVRPKKHSVHPSDLHLLLSTISSSATFRTPGGESWIPICLPRFNAKGFLHAYISFISEGVGVVLVSGDREGFFKMREFGDGVKEKLRKAGLVHKLEMGRSGQQYSLGELAIPGLRHFLYKSRAYVQVTFPAYEGDYEEDENKHRLITLYQRVHETIHARTAATGNARPAAKLVYLRTEHEAVLGWTTSVFELYLALSPLLPKTAVVSAARAVARWVNEEEGKLFLTSAPSF